MSKKSVSWVKIMAVITGSLFALNDAEAVKAVTKGGLGAVGALSGTAGVIESVSGDGPHTWGDVVSGAISGATATGSAAAVINAIPGIGNVSYGIMVAGGTVAGGVIAGSQIFSETDCLDDPVTGAFTCCHTYFNEGQRYADIGDYMFCIYEDKDANITHYGVRQCLQGNSPKKSSWFIGLFKDDFWQPECEYRYCNNKAPMAGLEQYIEHQPDLKNFCWNWTCKSGYKKKGNTCILLKTDTPVTPNVAESSINPYETAINKIEQQRQKIIKMCSDDINGGTMF